MIWETRVIHPSKPSSKMHLYFIQEGEDGPIKIGIATDVSARLRGIQSGNPRPLRVLFGTFAGHDGSRFALHQGAVVERPEAARWLERRWHKSFAHLCLRGEWFAPGADLLDAIAALRKLNPSEDYARQLLGMNGGGPCRG